ncbi:protein Cripto [Discoglossus pictus]
MLCIRYIVTFILSARFIKFGKGESCVGLQCDLTKLSQANLSSLISRLINEANNATLVKNPLRKNIQPFIGITDSRKLNKKCCQNGGTCFLGSFCMCPKPFTGRHCELDKRTLDCDGVSHGDWIREKCQLCRCFSGVLKCFTPEYETECDQRHKVPMSGGSRLKQNKMFGLQLFIALIMFKHFV